MGLSSKQVSIDVFDWSKTLTPPQKLSSAAVKRSHHHQNPSQTEQLKCPRCDSTNTKFCYYNNYNKSQPRHFCRACKRHWTNGGTLRNVPVGGGRKNKRLKKKQIPKSSSSSAAASAAVAAADGVMINTQFSLPLYQGLIFPPPPPPPPPSSTNWVECENFTTNYGILNSQNADFSGVSTTTDQELKAIETEQPNSTGTHHPWQLPTTNCSGADMSNSSYWSWEDIDTFATTDLNILWDDDHDIKP